MRKEVLDWATWARKRSSCSSGSRTESAPRASAATSAGAHGRSPCRKLHI